MKIPAAAPMITPLTRRLIFCWTSAFASSISSRMSVVARSEISWTAAGMLCAWGCPLSSAKAPQDDGQGDAAHEGGADEQLGSPDAAPSGHGELAPCGRLGLGGRRSRDGGLGLGRCCGLGR